MTSTMLNVLLVLLLTLFPTKASPLVTLSPLESNSGLYFEKIGEAHLSSNEWNLVIYFNLSAYWREPSILTHGIRQLSHICDTIKNIRVCPATISQLEETFKTIQERNELLRDKPAIRIKRGAVDLIGNIAHSLFGVLDSTYAQNMADTIRGIETNEHHLLSLIRNQTSHLDATAEVMQRSHEGITNQIEQLNRSLNSTLAAITQLTYNEQQTHAIEYFNTLATHVLLLMTAYEGTQATLLDVLIDSHHGKINPKLLSPHRLLDQLMVIKENLPANLQLSASQRDLPKIYSLLTIEGRILSNQILFRLKFPLLTQDSYEMLQVHVIPTYTKDGFIEIIPSTKYLSVNLARDLFYPISSLELSKCIVTDQSNYICKQFHPVLRKGPEVNNCEIAILSQSTPSAPCPITNSKVIPAWIQLHRPNHWIYVMNKPSDFHIVCGSIVQTKTLSGTGKLNVTNGCTIYNEAIILQASNFYLGVMDTSFATSGNFSPWLAPSDHEKTYLPTFQAIQETVSNISTLRERLHELQQEETTNFNHSSHHIHHYSIGYLNLALMAGILLYLCRKLCTRRDRLTIESAPTPSPRQINQPSFIMDPGLNV